MNDDIKNFSAEFLENAKLSPFTMKAIECIQHGMTPYAVIESLVKVIDDRDAEVLKGATLYPGGFLNQPGWIKDIPTCCVCNRVLSGKSSFSLGKYYCTEHSN